MVHGCRFASAHSAQPGILVPVRKIRRKAEESIASDCVSYYHFDSIGSIILKPGIPLYLRLENNYIAEETCIIWFRHVPHGKVAKAGGCIIRAPSAGVWDGLCTRLQDAIQQKVDAGLIQTFTKQMGPQMPFPQDSTRSDILACTMRYLLRGYSWNVACPLACSKPRTAKSIPVLPTVLSALRVGHSSSGSGRSALQSALRSFPGGPKVNLLARGVLSSAWDMSSRAAKIDVPRYCESTSCGIHSY